MLNRSKLAALLVLVCVWPALAWGQQEMRSATKGASTPLPITGSAIDADHNALDVKCLAGCTGGGGAGDASLAEQQAQTAILTTIDADTGTIAGAVKAEDGAHSSGHTGIPFWGVRNDSAATSLTDTNGDYTPIATDSNGRLFINAISSIFSVTPGTSATALGKAEDAVHSTGDTGVAILTKRTDTAASSADTNGDYATLNTDATGRVWTNTELPDADTLADDTSNPTVPGVASFNMCYDGTNWDRCTKATAGQGAVDTATQRVTIAQGATACPNYIAISQTADTTLVSGTASQYFYICSIILVAGAAEVVSLWEGTGTACGTGSTAILGSTTEANGLSVSANGGFSAVSGIPFLRTATAANDICLRQSGTNRVSGVLTYYKAP